MAWVSELPTQDHVERLWLKVVRQGVPKGLKRLQFDPVLGGQLLGPTNHSGTGIRSNNVQTSSG